MSLIRSTLVVSIAISISRIFGFVRDMLIARYLGAGMLSDAFFAAFRLPNFFRRIFAEGAFNNCFVPIFIDKLNKSKQQEDSIDNNQAVIFAHNIFSLLFYILLIFIIMMQIFMPQIINILFPGFANNSDKMTLTINLSRITIFYLLFIALVSLFSGILNSLNKFFVASTAPIILNLTLILMMLFAIDFFPDYANLLAWSVMIAGILQFLWLFIFTVKNKFLLYPKIPKIDVDIKKFLKRLLPAIIGANVMQINLLVDSIFASAISGAVSYLYYADRINQLPLAMIGIALSVALLPNLANKIKQDKIDDAIKIQNIAFEIALILAIPITIILIIFAHPIITNLFERGNFGNSESIAVSKALMLYSCGLPSFILVKIFEPNFFARGNSKTPMQIAIFCVITNILLNIIFHYLELGYQGIILAAIISSYVNLLLLVTILLKNNDFYFNKIFIKHLPKLGFSCLITFIIAIILKENFYQNYLVNINNFARFCLLIANLLLIIIINLIILYYSGILDIVRNIKKK